MACCEKGRYGIAQELFEVVLVEQRLVDGGKDTEETLDTLETMEH